MSAHVDQSDNGSGERATVALVNAKVATVDAKLDGVRSLIESEFRDIGERLEAVGRLGIKVDGMNDRLLMAEARLTTIERRHSYGMRDLPNILIGLGLFAVALAQFLHS